MASYSSILSEPVTGLPIFPFYVMPGAACCKRCSVRKSIIICFRIVSKAGYQKLFRQVFYCRLFFVCNDRGYIVLFAFMYLAAVMIAFIIKYSQRLFCRYIKCFLCFYCSGC